MSSGGFGVDKAKTVDFEGKGSILLVEEDASLEPVE